MGICNLVGSGDFKELILFDIQKFNDALNDGECGIASRIFLKEIKSYANIQNVYLFESKKAKDCFIIKIAVYDDFKRTLEAIVGEELLPYQTEVEIYMECGEDIFYVIATVRSDMKSYQLFDCEDYSDGNKVNLTQLLELVQQAAN